MPNYSSAAQMSIAGQSACGDKKGSERSLQMANRIKKVVAAGAAGAIVGGPVGAAEAAIPTVCGTDFSNKFSASNHFSRVSIWDRHTTWSCCLWSSPSLANSVIRFRLFLHYDLQNMRLRKGPVDRLKAKSLGTEAPAEEDEPSNCPDRHLRPLVKLVKETIGGTVFVMMLHQSCKFSILCESDTIGV
ncbi:hypothetical protein DAPPUDRAFT_100774 [Daphnia pulex]|uniref:Uncharacterized protein n=1 Tax=Daphnia pulex TaxID=6669 RepID=E9GC40_DAPPU|nr:hypothetical protein DAPPUDRAFT_100774 [Daphnia pulex]|eukprot:EFX82927.1 hypothetical protein DAPPUDRAFT_100774 [Daphnia pulex]